jgi:REP element-mobilizing transposase RayT
MEVDKKNPAIQMDDWVVMPNHWHAVIRTQKPIKTTAGAINCAPTIGNIVRGIKSAASVSIRRSLDLVFDWQKNYYEHVVRNEEEYLKIREYIRDNPRRWDEDLNNPVFIKGKSNQ